MATTQSNFNLVSSHSEATFSIEKYQSKQTGMKLYHINIPLPLIKVEICVQTNPYDDTGCPHTLEHLIFLGSRNYPQQGYLDYIAAQYYSTGTNATTYRDMTTYELTTINPRSLRILLPIYLDHIFHPLLTNDCYLTEIHHISGETSRDAGVVYSEMQAYENQPEEILLYSILHDLWSNQSPYHYEAGGRLEAIRNELTLDKIKTFHKKFYRPNNVAIILCGGGINIDEIFEMLNKLEQENFYPYENHRQLFTWNESQRKKTKITNSFIQSDSLNFDISSDTINKMDVKSMDTNKLSVQLTTIDGNESSFYDSESMVSCNGSSELQLSHASLLPIETDNSIFRCHTNKYKEICYPLEDDEENLGQVALSYRLESIYEIEVYTALDVLLTTLCDEDISIFYKEFIEIPNTLCSSIHYDWYNYPQRVLIITFEGVDVDNLTLVADKYSSVLYSILNFQIDNDRLYKQLKENIKKKIELHLNELENEPFDFLTDLCGLDHISELSTKIVNGNDDEQHLHKFLQTKSYLEKLFDRPLTYWHELIKKYLLEWDSTKRTTILLKPSSELLAKQQKQEEQRIAERFRTYGSDGLQKLKDELNQARLNNKQSSDQYANISQSFITFNNQLHLPRIELYSNTDHLDLFHCPTSHFNRYTLYIPIKNLPVDLQLYLPLFSNLLFHTSIQYENVSLSKFNFCELITRDLLSYSVSCGQSSSSPMESVRVSPYHIDTLIVSLESINNAEIYKNTIDYFRYVLFGTKLNDYQVIIEECEKQLKDHIETLRNGDCIHQAYFNHLIYSTNSNHYYHQMNMFVQKNLLKKICRQPNKYQNEILSKLECIRLFILKNLSYLHLIICGNVKLIEEHRQIIDEFINESKLKSQIEFDINEIDKINILPSLSTTIIGLQHEESSYVIQWTHVPISEQDFILLLIFSNYLNMENGPLWTACRTNGYAYGVAFDFDFNMNLILLSISRCSQLNAAYSKAMETLKNFVEHKINFDSKRIDAARNLTLCLLVEYLATLGRIKNVCIRSYLNKYSIEKYQNLINEVNLFTYNDEILLRIIEKYLSPLINHNQSSTLILVNSNKMKEIKEFLEQEYSIKNVTLIKNIEKYFSQ